MYILSKFKDYYDGVAGSVGVDKTIIYKRETVIIDKKKEMPSVFRETTWRDTIENDFISISGHNQILVDKQPDIKNLSHFIVGFCGKYYLGWKLYDNQVMSKSNNTTITYDHDYVDTITKSRGWGRRNKKLSDMCSNILTYDNIELFRKYNTPSFIYDVNYTGIYPSGERTFIVNPKLSDYDFYKVVDAFQSHQMIQSFLSGVLTNKEKEMVEIEDKYKIERFGFDKKWSFRKRPKQ